MATQTVSTSGSGLVFNNTYTANCSQQYISCIVAAENTYESLWSNSLTVNITFDEQATGKTGSQLASNHWFWVTESYAQLRNALPASDSLPSTDPTGGHTWHLPVAYARMLGLSSSAPSTDDTVTPNSSYNWSFGQDVTSTLEHEISEGVMGRVGGLGDQNGVWSTMDLFRYSSPGVPDFTDGRDGLTTYFSVNGSALSSLSFNNEFMSNGSKANSGDTADFTQSDVYGTGHPGETDTLSPTDITIMDALGWTQRTSPSPTPTPTPSPSWLPPAGTTNDFAVTDQSTTGSYAGGSWQAEGTPYSGPVAGLTSELIAVTPDNINVTASAPNVFISLDGGSGEDAIAVNQVNGNNVLNGSTGSSFLYGGSGDDTFFVDDRNPRAGSDIWSTVVGFHSGDAATIWGVTPSDFTLSWVDGQGAAGYTGLTLHATAPGVPTASLTLAGFTSADLTDGKLTVSFGTTAATGGLPGSTYMYVHAN
jgi:Ca2+-binding RTX toxin-like protein